MIAAAALIVLVALAALHRPFLWRTISVLLLLALLPIALSLTISILVTPVFIPRTMTATIVPGLLVLALGAALPHGKLRCLAIFALLVITGEMAFRDFNRRQHSTKDRWYQAIEWLQPRFAAKDIVLAYPNEGALPFRYALRDRAMIMPTRPIPTDIPTLDGGPRAWNPTGSRGVFSLPADRLQTIADSPEIHSVSTVWLLRLGPWAYDKGDHFLHALERDRRQIAHYKDGPIDIIGLRRNDKIK